MPSLTGSRSQSSEELGRAEAGAAQHVVSGEVVAPRRRTRGVARYVAGSCQVDAPGSGVGGCSSSAFSISAINGGKSSVSVSQTRSRSTSKYA